jgi:hypothetical protein
MDLGYKYNKDQGLLQKVLGPKLNVSPHTGRRVHSLKT